MVRFVVFHIYSSIMIQIEGYNNYFADKSGAIYSSNINRFLSPILNQFGYHYVILQKDGIKRKQLIHRLIAKCFLTYNDDRPFVNHIDGVKTNNCLSNLEWCNQSENTTHAFKIGLMKVSINSINNIRELGIKSSKKVINVKNGMVYNSAKEAAILEGINYKTLNGYLKNRYKNKTDLVYCTKLKN